LKTTIGHTGHFQEKKTHFAHETRPTREDGEWWAALELPLGHVPWIYVRERDEIGASRKTGEF
jgi:hypothetical protein